MVLPFFRSWRRRRLLEQPLPAHWPGILKQKYPFYSRLSEEDRDLFHDHLKVFIWEKHWEGAAGLTVTDEMKVTIGGAAARIARRLPISVYDRLTEIVIYCSDYRHPDNDHSIIRGQAHHFGTIVLSWDAVSEGVAIPNDARDTAIHEFAHVLDAGDGVFDGTPLLEKGRHYRIWADVMGRHLSRLRDEPLRGCLRAYGAQNEAEFFAVATEAFFETPRRLKRCAPELYDVLATYFNVDPT